MGCAVSRHNSGGGGRDDVVSLCKKRKKLLKLAVERRYAFANAQAKYNKSLYGVAMALSLFIARQSSPCSPFLITFPSSGTSVNSRETLLVEAKFHHHTPSLPISGVFACPSSSGSKVSLTSPREEVLGGSEAEAETESESESESGDKVCEHFYDDDVGCPKVQSFEQGFGWDYFFGPSDEAGVALARDLNGDRRELRELEGISKLEEDGEEVRISGEAENVDVGNGEGGGLKDEIEEKAVKEPEESNRLIDTPGNERELLDALKDVIDHFVKAYESGLEVSKMLEADRVRLHSGLEEIKESSSKLVRSITGSRSSISRSSSCRSVFSSSSLSPSTRVESKSDSFDDCGMQAGNHSLTLGRLYVWEKKLYAEVKAGDETRKLFEKKCSKLRDNDSGSDDSTNKSRAEVKELHARLAVTIASIESISNQIQKLRDEELHPQLLELLDGLMKYSKIMLDSHETQRRVMLKVKNLASSTYAKLSDDSQRLATVQLGAEVDHWHYCFIDFASCQKGYIEALCCWLSKFIDPEVGFYLSEQPTTLSCRDDAPPLLVTCRNWLACTEKMPEKTVSYAQKELGRNIRILWSQQGKELQQKRKVEALAKQLIMRALAFEKEERHILESQISMESRIAHLRERKSVLDLLKKRLEAQKAEHLSTVKDTKQITVETLKTGLCSIFTSLAEFSRACLNMYSHLVAGSSDAKEDNGNHTEEPGYPGPS